MIYIASKILYLFFKFIGLTYRFKYVGLENLELAKQHSNEESYIFATWHQNILSILLAHTDTKFSMIISSSKDGEYVSNVCKSSTSKSELE